MFSFAVRRENQELETKNLKPKTKNGNYAKTPRTRSSARTKTSISSRVL